MNIREVSPCIECPRNCNPIRLDEEAARKAGAHLLSAAIEQIDPTVSLPAEIQEDAESILRATKTPNITTRALGAIGVCGEKIGAGDCEGWQIDLLQPRIIQK